jgi:type II secretory pathway pseudopilin PulG
MKLRSQSGLKSGPGLAPLPAGGRSGAGRSVAAFTMVEIAIALGILAFALVAIIGVLPAGMKVQKENRDETVINQDGLFFLEAIRSGSKGLFDLPYYVDDLTNYVESVTVDYGRDRVVYTNNPTAGANRLTNGLHILGLLSMPRIERLSDGSYRSNSVVARVRAISGVAVDQSPVNNELAFRYLLQSEVTPFAQRPPGLTPSSLEEVRVAENLYNNLHDVRLTLRWPLYQRGNEWQTGRGRKTFRTLISGELASYRPPGRRERSLYWFAPSEFTTNILGNTF